MAKQNGKQEYAVIGLGRFGTSVALALAQRGNTVLGIDRNMRIVQELADELTQTVSLDSSDEEALTAVDIALYPVVIVSIGADFQAKLLTTLALKSLGVKRVICTASNEREKNILVKIGADQVVMPEIDSGRRLALSLAMPTLMDQLALGKGYTISDIQVPPSFVGKTVLETDVRRTYGLTLIALRRGEDVVVSPAANEVYQQADRMILIGKVDDLNRLSQVS